MHPYANVEINIFSIALMIIIFVNMRRPAGEYLPDQKLFFKLVIATMAILVVDSLQWILDGIPGVLSYYGNLISNVIYYSLQVLPPFYWCYYVRYQIKMNVKEALRVKVLLFIPIIINTMMTVLSCFYDMYFLINDNNYYVRGDYFWVSVVLTYFYVVYSVIYLLLFRRSTERGLLKSMLFFSLPPILGAIIQVFNYGFALIWPGVTISLVVIYLNIQKNQLYTDYLTGLYNRRLLDIHLNECLQNKGRFGVIMIDIDKFKQINDIFGHLAGDQALVETANILKKSVGRNGFTARYGGDEFVVIVPANDKSEVENVAYNIEQNVEQFNRRESSKYSIHLCMGYEIFDQAGKISKNDVLSLIDRQMYDEKFKHCVLDNQMSIQ